MMGHESFTCFLELSSFAFCVLSASSSWSINITRDGRVITSRWGLVVDLHSSLLFQAVFPQTSVVLSPGQASSLITASQFRHDIVAKAFCHDPLHKLITHLDGAGVSTWYVVLEQSPSAPFFMLTLRRLGCRNQAGTLSRPVQKRARNLQPCVSHQWR